MKIIEKFISINGEGLKAGELALFIRFSGCNLRCSYCDTTYSFINPKYEEESVDDLVKYILNQKIKNITITGGEPLIQDDIKELLEKLDKEDLKVEVETNGSISIEEFKNLNNVSFTLDYKLKSSNMESKMFLENYKFVTKQDSVKFVVGNIEDLNKMKQIIEEYDLINKTNCIVSPVFNKINFEEIVNFIKEYKLNGLKMQVQLHKIIWDPNKRGV